MVRRRRTSNPELAYLGVSAEAPPDVVIIDRDPTQNDTDFEISTLWLRRKSTKSVFMLLSKEQGIATWVQIYPVTTAAGAQNFITPNGTATADNGDITVDGGVGLQARATGLHTYVIEPDQPNQGNVFLSGVGFRPVTSPNGTISVNFTAGALELDVAATITNRVEKLEVDNGQFANPNANNTIAIEGGQNIRTTKGTNTVNIATTDSINLPGTTGTNTGVYKIDGERVLHTYPISGTPVNNNIHVGFVSGNFTQDPANTGNTSLGSQSLSNIGTANNNTALGTNALGSMTDAQSNTATGAAAGSMISTGGQNTLTGAGAGGNIDTGSQNSAFGDESLIDLVTGDRNIAVGFQSGFNYTADETNNILIGNPGVANEGDTIRIGNATHTQSLMAGVYNVTPSGSNIQTVVIDSNGQLGSSSSGGGVGNTVAFTGVQESTIVPTQPTYTLGVNSPLAEVYDIGNNFDPGGSGSAATFTAPQDGRYTFSIQLTVLDGTNVSVIPEARIVVNGTISLAGKTGIDTTPTSGEASANITATINLTSGDAVTFVHGQSSSNNQLDNGKDGTWVSGHQVG